MRGASSRLGSRLRSHSINRPRIVTSALVPVSDSSRPDDRRSLHHDKAGSLQMVDQTLRHDLRQHFIGIVLPPSAFEPEGEGARIRQVGTRGGVRRSVGSVMSALPDLPARECSRGRIARREPRSASPALADTIAVLAARQIADGRPLTRVRPLPTNTVLPGIVALGDTLDVGEHSSGNQGRGLDLRPTLGNGGATAWRSQARPALSMSPLTPMSIR
jgi:hypothetical protein